MTEMPPFRFGPEVPPGSVGGCCGTPVGCRIHSRGCLHKVEKAAWQERAAQPSDYVKCQVCECAMRSTVAAAHLRTHLEAGDLIRAAHVMETTEAKEAKR